MSDLGSDTISTSIHLIRQIPVEIIHPLRQRLETIKPHLHRDPSYSAGGKRAVSWVGVEWDLRKRQFKSAKFWDSQLWEFCQRIYPGCQMALLTYSGDGDPSQSGHGIALHRDDRYAAFEARTLSIESSDSASTRWKMQQCYPGMGFVENQTIHAPVYEMAIPSGAVIHFNCKNPHAVEPNQGRWSLNLWVVSKKYQEAYHGFVNQYGISGGAPDHSPSDCPLILPPAIQVSERDRVHLKAPPVIQIISRSHQTAVSPSQSSLTPTAPQHEPLPVAKDNPPQPNFPPTGQTQTVARSSLNVPLPRPLPRTRSSNQQTPSDELYSFCRDTFVWASENTLVQSGDDGKQFYLAKDQRYKIEFDPQTRILAMKQLATNWQVQWKNQTLIVNQSNEISSEKLSYFRQVIQKSHYREMFGICRDLFNWAAQNNKVQPIEDGRLKYDPKGGAHEMLLDAESQTLTVRNKKTNWQVQWQHGVLDSNQSHSIGLGAIVHFRDVAQQLRARELYTICRQRFEWANKQHKVEAIKDGWLKYSNPKGEHDIYSHPESTHFMVKHKTDGWQVVWEKGQRVARASDDITPRHLTHFRHIAHQMARFHTTQVAAQSSPEKDFKTSIASLDRSLEQSKQMNTLIDRLLPKNPDISAASARPTTFPTVVLKVKTENLLLPTNKIRKTDLDRD